MLGLNMNQQYEQQQQQLLPQLLLLLLPETVQQPHNTNKVHAIYVYAHTVYTHTRKSGYDHTDLMLHHQADSHC
jgi:hypothetical protein